MGEHSGRKAAAAAARRSTWWLNAVQLMPVSLLTHRDPGETIPAQQTALDRRKTWKKFGDAATERATDAITSKATEDIPFERLARQKQTQEEKNKATDFQVGCEDPHE